MNYYRPSGERGGGNFGWLDTKHTFSFGNYYDPKHMGFSTLRVINDDRIAPGGGFPPHGHRDMEIVTVVQKGALSHKDSMGNGSTILPGDVQRMSAGTGIRHSEFNASDTEELHLLQIWILPGEAGIEPGYEQKHFDVDEKRGRARLIASRDGREGSVAIHQDANLLSGVLAPAVEFIHEINDRRHSWLHIMRGDVVVNGVAMTEGDGLGLVDEERLVFLPSTETEFLLFELERGAAS